MAEIDCVLFIINVFTLKGSVPNTFSTLVNKPNTFCLLVSKPSTLSSLVRPLKFYFKVNLAQTKLACRFVELL